MGRKGGLYRQTRPPTHMLKSQLLVPPSSLYLEKGSLKRSCDQGELKSCGGALIQSEWCSHKRLQYRQYTEGGVT